jgi:S1-C subfamily serine protease
MPRAKIQAHFNRSWLAAVLLWSAAGLASEPKDEAKPLDPAAVFQSASPSVVVVQVATENGESQGSGVVAADGEVVTNFHVIKGARGLVTVKQGSRSWRAEVSGVDEESDLARLTVLLRRGDSFDLPVASLRVAQELQVGERVYAIGAPRGLERTLTEGLISGLPSAEGQTFVQTSAAISSGSSGGGLFDARGELIGITTMYLRESQNLNFAVPADRVKWLMGRPYTPHVPATPPPRPSGTQPAAATAADREVPIALGHVRTIYLVAEARGPIATRGDLTSEWLVSRIAQRLRKAGLKVITNQADLRANKTYVALVGAELSSLDASDSGFYPWMLSLDLSDRTQFTDGSKAHVTVWKQRTHGYGGNQVVVEQVVEMVDQMADKLALAILGARPGL